MGADDELSGDRYPSQQPFTTALADLKQDGAAVLVVGDVPASVGRTVRQRLFGEQTTPPRRRIAISTTTSSSPPLVPEAGIRDPNRWTHLAYSTERRSVASHSPTASSERMVIDRECESLPELGIAVTEAIDEFESGTEELSPAQLRLGFDSIFPLVDANEETLFRFLHLLIARVKSVQGMAHFPLPLPVESEIVQTFTPLFDALVELSVIDGIPHQRWRFPADGPVSEWLPL